MAPFAYLLSLSALASPWVIHAQNSTTVCAEGKSPCEWTDSFIITRLWKLKDESKMSTQDVAEEFEQGFAPKVTTEPGFVAYAGAPSVDDEKLVFFYNVFDSEENSLNAQEAAAAFKADGVLNEEINPELFTTGAISFQILAEKDCSEIGSSEHFYRVSVYELGDLSAEELTKNAEEGLGPKLTEEEGFLMYLGATVKSSDKEDMALFMSIYETQEGSEAGLKLATDWVAGSGEFEDLDGNAGGGSEVFDGKAVSGEVFEESFNFGCAAGSGSSSYSYSYSM